MVFLVGDIESMHFSEALRQLQIRVGSRNFAVVHVSLVPWVSGSPKTKPTQHGVRDLRALGLPPDVIICRSERPIPEDTRQKIALFCHVPVEAAISVHNVSNLYHVPMLMAQQGVIDILAERFGLSGAIPRYLRLPSTRELVQPQQQPQQEGVASSSSSQAGMFHADSLHDLSLLTQSLFHRSCAAGKTPMALLASPRVSWRLRCPHMAIEFSSRVFSVAFAVEFELIKEQHRFHKKVTARKLHAFHSSAWFVVLFFLASALLR